MIIHDGEREYQDWAARLTDRVDHVSCEAVMAFCLAVFVLFILTF